MRINVVSRSSFEGKKLCKLNTVQYVNRGIEMNIDLPVGVPKRYDMRSQFGRTLKVFRGGLSIETPKRSIAAYIPEGIVADIPRALASCCSADWLYWENAEIPTRRKQRPPRIKYQLLHNLRGSWYIEVIDDLNGYSRKVREAEEKVLFCREIDYSLSGIILIINALLCCDLSSEDWPLNIAISYYSNEVLHSE